MNFWNYFFSKNRSFKERFFVSLLISACGFLVISLLYNATARYYTSISVLCAMIIALYGGLFPGFLFVVLLSLSADYFYIPEIGKVLDSSASIQHSLVLWLVALAVSTLCSSIRFAFQQTESAKKRAEEAEKELQASVKARDELIGVISHELKNPLTTLQIGLELTQRVFPKIPENETALKHLRRLYPSIQKMRALISDLLDITRLEAKALHLELSPCDLWEVIQEVVRSYTPQAEEAMLQLQASIDPQTHDVYCDPRKTSQILGNLISNSMKFTQQGGLIQISTRKLERCVEVRVADNGKGIREDQLPHLFDRFWQAKETSHLGTGLGLSIVKGLVEAQGGEVHVESHWGEGSCFSFTLPIASALPLSNSNLSSRLAPKAKRK